MENHVLRALKDASKRIVHATGGLPAYHALRNERVLTVIAFHRVLPPDDPRAHDADPDWTVSLDHFADCVAFARRHFNVVGLEEVLEARRRGAPLPPHPLLLTFDDGWADNAEYAVPVLTATRTPAVIFVASDAIGRMAPFWRESLRAAARGGRLDDEIWEALWSGVGRADSAHARSRSDEGLEELLRHLFEDRTRAERDALLAPWEQRLADGRRHMMTREELKAVHAKGIAIGAHGHTHEPMSACEDLDDELAQPREHLGALLEAPITTLAFPHSRFTPSVLQRAERLGYELVFTGAHELTPTHVIPFAVGRVAITPGAFSAVHDRDRRFRPERLALHLFRRPHLHAWA